MWHLLGSARLRKNIQQALEYKNKNISEAEEISLVRGASWAARKHLDERTTVLEESRAAGFIYLIYLFQFVFVKNPACQIGFQKLWMQICRECDGNSGSHRHTKLTPYCHNHGKHHCAVIIKQQAHLWVEKTHTAVNTNTAPWLTSCSHLKRWNLSHPIKKLFQSALKLQWIDPTTTELMNIDNARRKEKNLFAAR